jgi:cellulase
MKSSTILHLIGAAQAHTIMQAFNGNPQGAGIYMPSDDSVKTDFGIPHKMAAVC